MDAWEWSENPSGCLGVFGRPSRMSGSPSQMSGSGQEALQRFGRPAQMSGSCGETLPDFSEGWEVPPDVL